MKYLVSALALAVAGFAPAAFANSHKEAPTMQQSKMKTCNVEAKGKKGDEHKAFMKQCLSADGAASAPAAMTQQDKMTACNVEAKGKKGDEYKALMKECLSK